ncbi:RNA-directed DNA polymerase, eukaryota, reverse transcriptase zinc-binding domain protein [Tanacetum coccineum]
MIWGVWLKTGKDLLIVAVYAPHDLKDKQMLWDYLTHEITKWKGEVVIMGDFNEVRYKSDRFGSMFNVQGANMFNLFIDNAGLEEVPLGGISFTWCHKSASKMSKLDMFLISKNLLITCPNITAITLERYLSDHRPILLRESHFDYGPTPFRFFHYWLEMEGFNKIVEDAWSEAPRDDSNAMISMMKKLKYLKLKIREWNKGNMKNMKNVKAKYKEELEVLEAIIDKGDGYVEVVNKRIEAVKMLQDIDKLQALEMAQKAKVKWSIEGDENSSFFHGVLNKKQSQLNIRGIMVDGIWNESPNMVELKLDVSKEEIKRAVWDCGTDKSPGPDGFTFGCNSSFIALIPKIPDANLVKDFRPISLIGSLYKIIAKILANRLVGVLGDIVNESKKKQSLIFKVDFEKAYDSVRWDFLDDILKKFGFGDKWCNWIQSCLRSLRGTKVEGSMSRIQAWNEVVDRVKARLSKWKMKALSIGVIFFNGHELKSKPSTWVKWNNVLAPKEKGGLGVSSLYALNRGLMCKWVWRFYTHNASLWARVIKAIHGDDGKVGKHAKGGFQSCWLNIVHEINVLKKQGIIFFDFMRVKLGNGDKITFWEDKWVGGNALKDLYPRMYALETCKSVNVGTKLAYSRLDSSFRRKPRGGVEQEQYEALSDQVHDVTLVPMSDRWLWSLESSGEFSVASIRKAIDDKRLPEVATKTRWIKYVPIKVNVHAWKVKIDSLSTRINISRRGIDIDSIMCPICDNGAESSSHLFFTCRMVRQIVRKISHWWDVPYDEVNSYEDLITWLVNLRLSSKLKQMLESVFYMKTLDVTLLLQTWFADEEDQLILREPESLQVRLANKSRLKGKYADIFTKALPLALFEEFFTSLSVRSHPAQTAW